MVPEVVGSIPIIRPKHEHYKETSFKEFLFVIIEI